MRSTKITNVLLGIATSVGSAAVIGAWVWVADLKREISENQREATQKIAELDKGIAKLTEQIKWRLGDLEKQMQDTKP